MNVQTIIAPNGDELVVLTKRAYQNLLSQLTTKLQGLSAGEIEDMEDQFDILSAQLASLGLQNGQTETIPADIANRLLDGENPILVWRFHRKLAQGDLARTVKISAGHLSDIESGRRSASVNVLKKLAQALNVTLDDLV